MNVKADDPRVDHVATLKLAREGVLARLLTGQVVEPADLLKLDAALRG